MISRLSMRRTFNRVETKSRRQYLRKNLTKAEKLLWAKLRSKRLADLKFRRQCGIENYIVDFYCPEIRLAIEVDGDTHGYSLQRRKDAKREKRLAELGIKLLRFTNVDIAESMEGVLEKMLSNHPPPPSLSKEGE